MAMFLWRLGKVNMSLGSNRYLECTAFCRPVPSLPSKRGLVLLYSVTRHLSKLGLGLRLEKVNFIPRARTSSR